MTCIAGGRAVAARRAYGIPRLIGASVPLARQPRLTDRATKDWSHQGTPISQCRGRGLFACGLGPAAASQQARLDAMVDRHWLGGAALEVLHDGVEWRAH